MWLDVAGQDFKAQDLRTSRKWQFLIKFPRSSRAKKLKVPKQ